MPGATAVGVAGATAAGLTAGTTAFVVVSTTISLAVSIGASFALSAALKAIQGKPDLSSLSGSSPGRTQTTKQAVSPRKVVYGKTRVAGTQTFLHFTHNNGLFHMVITLTGHPIESFEQYFINDEEQFLDAKGKPTSGSWNGGGKPRVRIVGGTGTTAGDAAFHAAMQANLPGVWTEAHRQTGCAKIYVVGATNNFPGGLPNVTVVVKGKNDIFDPRSSTSGYTDNAALCIRDYLTTPLLGVGEPSSVINDVGWNAEANICDEAVALAAGGTEKRYTVNGQFTKKADDMSVLGRMMSACAGTLTHQGGEYTLYTGAYRSPTITFDENQIVGPVEVKTLIGREELFNRVKGTFINPDDFYQEVPFPAVTNATYLAEDQNEELWKPGDVFYPFTDSASRCQRLAKIELERVRQQTTEALPLNLQGMRVQMGDVVGRTHDTRSWVDKPFEIKEWAFVDRGNEKAPKIGVEMVLRETASTVYDWNSGEETTVDPAPDTNFPNPFDVPAPTGATVISDQSDNLFFSGDGTLLTRLKVEWVNPPGPYFDHIETQFKLTVGSEWHDGPDVVNSNEHVFLGPVTDGAQYDVRLRAVSVDKFPSAWVTPPPHTVIGKQASPPAVFDLFLEGGILRWKYSNPPIDFLGFQIRINDGANVNWSNAQPLHDGFISETTFPLTGIPVGTKTILIRAFDSSDNPSDVTFIVRNLGDLLVDNVVETVDFDADGYPGTITNGTVIGSELKADSFGAVFWTQDSDPFWSGDNDLFWTEQFKQMIYEATVTPRQDVLDAILKLDLSVVADNWSVEYKPGNQAGFWTKDADPFWTGDANPMWDSNDPGYKIWPGTLPNILHKKYTFRVIAQAGQVQGTITNFDVVFDVPDEIERIDDFTVAAGGSRLPITKIFRSIKNIELTLHDDAGTAITAKIIDKDKDLGPLIKTFDNANASVQGLIDATIQGVKGI
jgi:hypothetical protein